MVVIDQVTYISWWLINYIYNYIYGGYMVVISQLLLGSHALLLSTPGMRNSSTEGLSQRCAARPLVSEQAIALLVFALGVYNINIYIYGVIYLYRYIQIYCKCISIYLSKSSVILLQLYIYVISCS